MGFLFNLFTLTKASGVVSNAFTAINNPHCAQIGMNTERFLHRLMRDRVVVPIKADIRCFARPHFDSLMGIKRVIR